MFVRCLAVQLQVGDLFITPSVIKAEVLFVEQVVDGGQVLVEFRSADDGREYFRYYQPGTPVMRIKKGAV